MPNAFSPDGDGDNDWLEVFTHNSTVLEFLVYDRWGNLVFEHHGLQPVWDGHFRGKLANVGVYAYLLHYRNDLTGEEEYVNGDVTLIH